MALYHTYRPQQFDTLLGQDHIKITLQNALKTGKIGHGYLFAGPRGLGKTTTARLLAKAVNCLELNDGELCNNTCAACLSIMNNSTMDVVEIDAASNRGIDEIRELREMVKFPPTQLKTKVIIIDEVHMLTKEAFNALLKTLEEPPPHTLFILATTEAHKVQPTILSRVQRFDFKRADLKTLSEHLKNVSKKERKTLNPDAADLLATLAEGSFRDSLTLLDQVSSNSEKTITLKDVQKILGLSDNQQILQFFEAIGLGDRPAALKVVDDFLTNGGDPGNFISQSIDFIRTKLRDNPTPQIVNWLKGMLDALNQLKISPTPNLPLELFIAEHIQLTANRLQTTAITKENRHVNTELETVINIEPTKTSSTTQLEIQKLIDKPSIPPNQPTVPATSTPIKAPVTLTEQNWHQLVEEMKEINAPLAAILKDSHLAEAANGEIKIAVKFKFHEGKICDRKNRPLIEQMFEKLIGQPIRVSCIVDPNYVKFREASESVNLIDDAIAVFEEI